MFEVADQFLGCRLYGIDISPIQPKYVPPNTQFIVMDLNNGLKFDDGSTDLVHSRYTETCNALIIQIGACWDYRAAMASIHERSLSYSETGKRLGPDD